ncbi:MAG: hypothetical protein NTY37_09865 [Methanothrix sp.]|nr:hypothetical protein [Methanothrix sp.]
MIIVVDASVAAKWSRPNAAVYDCLYLVLVEALDGSMVTADGKFFQPWAAAPCARGCSGWKIWNAPKGPRPQSIGSEVPKHIYSRSA